MTETFTIDACEEAFVRDFCPYKGSPDPLVVWRAAWRSAQSWQPIETAPKDGTTVLIGYDGGSHPNATAAYIHQPYSKPAKFDTHYQSWQVEPRHPPTHWMPLPTPPVA